MEQTFYESAPDCLSPTQWSKNPPATELVLAAKATFTKVQDGHTLTWEQSSCSQDWFMTINFSFDFNGKIKVYTITLTLPPGTSPHGLKLIKTEHYDANGKKLDTIDKILDLKTGAEIRDDEKQKYPHPGISFFNPPFFKTVEDLPFKNLLH
ncbi:hypothetical protein K1X76_06645 [bacterium]|nr:hypothetical protein [bacterium]